MKFTYNDVHFMNILRIFNDHYRVDRVKVYTYSKLEVCLC